MLSLSSSLLVYSSNRVYFSCIDVFLHSIELETFSLLSVTIAQEWLDKLPPRTPAEEDRLRQVSTTGSVNSSSRLGCQIVLEKSLDGMTVAMVEERPWYTL